MANNIKSVPEAYDPCFLLPILSDLVKSGKSKSQGHKTTQLSCYKKIIMGYMKHDC